MARDLSEMLPADTGEMCQRLQLSVAAVSKGLQRLAPNLLAAQLRQLSAQLLIKYRDVNSSATDSVFGGRK